jgi:hypothetical protein
MWERTDLEQSVQRRVLVLRGLPAGTGWALLAGVVFLVASAGIMFWSRARDAPVPALGLALFDLLSNDAYAHFFMVTTIVPQLALSLGVMFLWRGSYTATWRLAPFTRAVIVLVSTGYAVLLGLANAAYTEAEQLKIGIVLPTAVAFTSLIAAPLALHPGLRHANRWGSGAVAASPFIAGALLSILYALVEDGQNLHVTALAPVIGLSFVIGGVLVAWLTAQATTEFATGGAKLLNRLERPSRAIGDALRSRPWTLVATVVAAALCALLISMPVTGTIWLRMWSAGLAIIAAAVIAASPPPRALEHREEVAAVLVVSVFGAAAVYLFTVQTVDVVLTFVLFAAGALVALPVVVVSHFIARWALRRRWMALIVVVLGGALSGLAAFQGQSAWGGMSEEAVMEISLVPGLLPWLIRNGDNVGLALLAAATAVAWVSRVHRSWSLLGIFSIAWLVSARLLALEVPVAFFGAIGILALSVFALLFPHKWTPDRVIVMAAVFSGLIVLSLWQGLAPAWWAAFVTPLGILLPAVTPFIGQGQPLNEPTPSRPARVLGLAAASVVLACLGAMLWALGAITNELPLAASALLLFAAPLGLLIGWSQATQSRPEVST